MPDSTKYLESRHFSWQPDDTKVHLFVTKKPIQPCDPNLGQVSRRLFFGTAAAATSAFASEEQIAQPDVASGSRRARQAYRVRTDTAQLQRDIFQPSQTPNGDEAQLANKSATTPKVCLTMQLAKWMPMHTKSS